MKKMISIILSIIALTVMAPGHAETTNKDLECLAKNIFYEAGSEPEEGKVAVGIVTMNRVRDGFGRTICDVVHQRTVLSKSRTVQETETVRTGWFGRTKEVTVTRIEQITSAVCQFSWVCERAHLPKMFDTRWQESRRIAQALADGEYIELIEKYNSALYFHNTRVRPSWARQKVVVAKFGGHIFYSDKS